MNNWLIRLALFSLALPLCASHLSAADVAPKGRKPGAISAGQFILVHDAKAEFRDKGGSTPAESGKLYRVQRAENGKVWVMGESGSIPSSAVVDAKSAMGFFTKRLYERPDYNDYLSRAQSYAVMRRYNRAITDYDSALMLNPDSLLAHTGKGNCLQAKGDHRSAIKAFGAALKIDPNFAAARNNRGNAWRALAEYEKALSDYSVALRERGASPGTQFGSAVCLSALGRNKEAIRAFSAVLNTQADNAEALNERGLVYQKEGDFKHAIADYVAAAKANSRHFNALNNLAWLLANCKDKQLRDPAKALGFAKKACSVTNHSNWYCLGTLAATQARNGRFGDAVKSQKKAIELMPGGIAKADIDDYQRRLKLYLTAATKKR